MSAYVGPIYTAILVFAILAIILWVPWLIYTYRKYGFLSIWTTIISFSFIFYMLSALFLVLLPLPSTYDTCSMQNPNTQHYSLMPFRFIQDTLAGGWFDATKPGSYVLLFKQPAFYQAFFNFLLLMPLGVYLRYFFTAKKNWWKVAIVVFLVTLFYEITQVTGIYGIYNCAYRIFDVDDLMLNTLGGILGFFVAPAVLALFPSRKKIEERAQYLLEHDEVKAMVVLLAAFIDFFLIDLICQIVVKGIMSSENEVTSFIFYTIIFVIWMLIVPIIWSGQTVGTKIMRFRYDSKISIKKTKQRMAKRFVALYLAYFTTVVAGVLNNITVTMDSPYYKASVFLTLASVAIMGILSIVLFIHLMLVVFGKGKRRFFFDEAANLFTTRKMKKDKKEK